MKKNKKGFTLIEIIVVVVILAVLMAVAVPAVLGYINEADNAKYLTVSRAINEEVNVHISKTMAASNDKDFSETIAQLKKDLNWEGKQINSIVSTKPLNGEMIYSIDCEFDGETSVDNKGWAYNGSLKNHTITKISIWYRKDTEASSTPGMITEGTKFVVTMVNEKMYTYLDNASIRNGLYKKEGPIIKL